MKVIMSYPRSGNHLVRFFIELLTETPTLGSGRNPLDRPIFQNNFPEHVPFNISSMQNYNVDKLFKKHHVRPERCASEMIFIVRNPKEVLLRQNNFTFKKQGGSGYDTYFQLIDYFNNFNGKKILFFYEDIITDKIKFIENLCGFLNINKEQKKLYVLQNIDKLYNLSKQGKNRAWGGVKSDSVDFYYKNIKNIHFKKRFDDYIESKMQGTRYELIKSKYNL